MKTEKGCDYKCMVICYKCKELCCGHNSCKCKSCQDNSPHPLKVEEKPEEICESNIKTEKTSGDNSQQDVSTEPKQTNGTVNGTVKAGTCICDPNKNCIHKNFKMPPMKFKKFEVKK